MHVIEILGTGSSDHLKLGLVAAGAAARAGVEADGRQVTDRRRIESSGVLGRPGFVIDGVVASAGHVLSAAEIGYWLVHADRLPPILSEGALVS